MKLLQNFFQFILKDSYSVASNYLSRKENLPLSSWNNVINAKLNAFFFSYLFYTWKFETQCILKGEEIPKIFPNLLFIILLDKILPKLVNVFVLLIAELKYQVFQR